MRLKRICKHAWKRLVAMALVIAMLNTSVGPVSVQAEDIGETGVDDPQTVTLYTDDANGNTGNTDGNEEPGEESGDAADTSGSAGDTETKEQENVPAEQNVYDSGLIRIYNLEQLEAVGTGAQVYSGDDSADTFGTGDAVTDEDGNAVVYGNDAAYMLMNEISLDSSDLWQLPAGFAGSFTGTGGNAGSPLYDAETDTIYIYNNYQLGTANDPEALKTVMSNDMIAEEFGMGQIVFADEAEETQVEYTDAHNYVLTTDFTSEMPELKAAEVQDEVSVQLGGREFIGQSAMKIDGETYILIGNEKQLRAIGDDVAVVPMYFKREWVWGTNYKLKPYYPGDADLNITTLSDAGIEKDDIKFDSTDLYNITGIEGDSFEKHTDLLNDSNIGGSTTHVTSTKYVISIDEEGNKQLTADSEDNEAYIKLYKDLKYTTEANYIIFRDIDLNNEPWEPLMFHGNMIGAKADAQHTIESLVAQSDEEMVEVSNIPVISNINVETSGTLNREETQGVGFFASVSTEALDTSIEDKFGDKSVPIYVKNIQLDKVKIVNGYSGFYEPPGGLIGLLEEVLKKIPGLGEALSTDDFDVTAASTGAFAGRVFGEVKISNCSVTNLQHIESQSNATGGFVGSAKGKTLYAGLLKALSGVVWILETILNIIPLLDVGTLLEILLNGGLLDLSELEPVGFVAPSFNHCSVTYDKTVSDNTQLIVNKDNKDYYGGFIGYQAGAQMKNCTVDAPNGLEINAENHAGGFAGMATDVQILGLLTSIGVDIDFSTMVNNSFILGSSVNGDIQVNASNYSGGMVGSLCNSYLVDSGVNGNTVVNATQSYAGGLVGYSTLGEAFSLASQTDNEGKSDLLDLLSELLGLILNGNADADLLSLAGIYPAVIAGCYLTGDTTVTATENYAGGITGRGDGVQIISSAELSASESVQQEEETGADDKKAQFATVSRVWNEAQEVLNYVPLNQENSISNLVEVSAKNNAGGAIGQANAVNMSGILNNTLAPYMKPFMLQDTQITGTDIQISSEENYAGGAIGAGFGGDISNVVITGMGSVSAKNCAGGFAGALGTADVLDVGGLNVLGLGLINISSLITLGSTLRVTIQNSSVTGKDGGYAVSATGSSENNVDEFYAGGFIGSAMAVKAENCTADKVSTVTADTKNGYAGGFAGMTQTEGLADTFGTDGESTEIISLVNISQLLDVAPYLMCEFDKPQVKFNGTAKVTADVAGGFAGELQSTLINKPNENEAEPEAADAVTGIKEVAGSTYAGGFAGRIMPGAFVSAGKGLGVLGGSLNISIDDLLSLINAYYSEIYAAGVVGDEAGFFVSAQEVQENDSNAGSAGGYLGYGNALTIKKSSVRNLATGEVAVPDNLQAVDGSKYFEDQNQYAVTGARYAGGYAGKVDIGSTAAVNGKLTLTGVLGVGDVATALQVMASEISDSDVSGVGSGFSVLAGDAQHKNDGIAGGYIGSLEGSRINNSDVNGFEYVIGEVSAGGYAGRMLPGDVLSLLSDTSLLNKVVDVSGALASLMSYYIPIINDSSTNAVPCGGIVRAECAADGSMLRGTAGGYVGYSEGGRIAGNSEECAANRIRSVYGFEHAGGYTGYMKAADTLGTGSVSLLNDLISLDNLLGALDIVYPIQTNTAVYGPLQNVDIETWNKWVEAIGSDSDYKEELMGSSGDSLDKIDTEEEMEDFVSRYSYGYDITAGRSEYSAEAYASAGGTAGGYAGMMQSGKIVDGHTYQVGEVIAMSAAGGFVGDMRAGGLAEVGSLTLFGSNISLGNLLQAVQILIPNIKGSSAQGFTSGMVIEATGRDTDHNCGDAGGFAGRISGGHINTGDDENTGETKKQNAEKSTCTVTRLRGVKGMNHVGGFAGVIESGAAAALDTKVGEGEENPIQDLLDAIWNVSGGNLASVLDVVVPNIEYASVTGMDTTGFSVYGDADYAGGFAGMLNGAVIGRNDQTDGIQVNNLKRVVGGKYAGGMFGLADVSSAASVTEGGSSILDLIQTQEVGLLENFRSYIYEASVNGVESGFSVEATEEAQVGSGTTESTAFEGNAGGFGGTMQNGVVENSEVTNLASVRAKSYTGGFIGHMDKSGTVDADQVGIGQLINLSAGVLDVFGTHVFSSSVSGIPTGFTVRSTGGTLSKGEYVQAVAGGFAGFANSATIMNKEDGDAGCSVTNLKQVSSDEIAGGFVGKTEMAYLVNAESDSVLIEALLRIVQGLLDVLYTGDLQNIDLADINLGIIEVKLLSDGDVAYVNLLGLQISVSLGEPDDTGNKTVHVTIGDSEITLHCSEDGKLLDGNTIEIHLIKANRTRIINGMVTGVDTGYDVFGGGADNDQDGKGANGFAGGFVGYNNEGLLEHNKMVQADTVRAADNQVGAFSGSSNLKTVYDWNSLSEIEGTDNTYNVYRKWDDIGLTKVLSKNGTELSSIVGSTEAGQEIGGIAYYVYPVQHMKDSSMYKHGDVWEEAYQVTANEKVKFPIDVYVSSAQADLMLGTPTTENEYDPEGSGGDIQDPCDIYGEHTIQKIWKDDNNPDRPESVEITLNQDGKQVEAVKGEQNPLVMTDEMASGDDSIWSTTIHAPTYKEDGNKYEYSVMEKPVDGYATIYNNLDYYTHQIINYLPTELIREDTVVIDYGLSVDIDVLTNDKAAEIDGAKLAGVAISNGETAVNTELINKVTNTLDKSFTAVNSEEQALTGTYGTAYIKAGENGVADEIRFTPNTMEMDSCQQIMYAVQLPDNNGQSQYVYGMVTVVPATIIYYEDNSGAIHYKDGGYSTEKLEEDELANLTDDKDNWKTHGKWSIVTDGKVQGSDVQDTDRPGEAEIKEVIDNVYGNDTHYTDCNTYSNGSSHYVRVSAVNTYQNGGTSPMATFTFKGTGFDLISLTSRDTGAVTIRVYKGSNNTGERILNHTVDTYYGYTCTRDKETGRLIWTPDESSTDILYQIPILKEEMEEYGQYYVEVVPMYYDMYDKYDDKYYDIYVDAVRIYDPADPKDNDYKVIEDVYQTDGENHPDYTELRQILLNAENVGGEIPNGAVFVDGNGELGDISAYESFGPKNEVYLAPGQAISFYLWTNEKPDKVQLGAKLALGTDTKLAIATAVQEGDPEAAESWSFYKVKNWDINTSYDMYYEFTDNCVWEEADGKNPYMTYRTAYPIVIANPKTLYEDGKLAENEDTAILSLTNLQWTGRTSGATEDVENQPGTEGGTAPGQDDVQTRMAKAGARTMQVMTAEDMQDSITLMASVAPENIPAAYYFINQSDSSEEDGGQTTPGEGEEGGGQTTPGEGEEGGSQTTPGEGEEGGGQTTPGEGEEGGSQTTPETGDNNAQQKPAGQAPGNNEDSAGDPADKTPDKSGYSAVQTGDMVAAAGFAVLFAMMALSAIAASAAVYYRRKRR